MVYVGFGCKVISAIKASVWERMVSIILVANYELRITSCELRMTSYELSFVTRHS